jgi:DNA-binding response OmpR family regulator
MSKPLIFIIEDDTQLNHIFSIVLKNDFQVTSILDGTQALAQLALCAPDLVVLDMNLPGVSGRERF